MKCWILIKIVLFNRVPLCPL